MDPITSALPPEQAREISLISRLMYESREHRQMVLDSAGARDEDSLLARIRAGDTDEHPAYEQYLSLCILADLHAQVRSDLADRVKESRQQ